MVINKVILSYNLPGEDEEKSMTLPLTLNGEEMVFDIPAGIYVQKVTTENGTVLFTAEVDAHFSYQSIIATQMAKKNGEANRKMLDLLHELADFDLDIQNDPTATGDVIYDLVARAEALLLSLEAQGVTQ